MIRSTCSWVGPSRKAGSEGRRKCSGATTANKVMKSLRAAWNQALELHEELPRNLLAGSKRQRGFAWNDEFEGGPLVPFHELPQRWRDVPELPAC